MKFRLTIHPDIEEELAVSVKKDSALINKAKELVSEYNGEGKIIAFTEDDIKLLSPSEIECVMVNDGKTEALTISGERFRLKKRLYELEEILPSDFIKINKSCVANNSEDDINIANLEILNHGWRNYESCWYLCY